MALDRDQTMELATMLAAAADAGESVTPFAGAWDLDEDSAYAVQAKVVGLRFDGARQVGWKVGLTSEGMRQMIGADHPNRAPLFDRMRLDDAGACPTADLIAPRVEPEVAFVLGADLAGAGLSEDDVLAATDRVVPALEIADSRIFDWKFTAEEMVADHGAAARFVLGAGGCAPDAVDLAAVQVVQREDGAEVDAGSATAVLGHPARAIAWLAEEFDARGERLRRGDVVLSGSIVPARPIVPGTRVEADFGQPLGSVNIDFEPSEVAVP
jgi:2-keto-4-pentenoate hydratase